MWTTTFPARALAAALTAQSEFWEHVELVRDGDDPIAVATPYLKRRHARRLELVAAYLGRAAEFEDQRTARVALWSIVPVAYLVNGIPGPRSPQRAARVDLVDSIARAAIRVARRGAGRCSDPRCCGGLGAILSCRSHGDYCSACRGSQPDPRSDVESERVLFDRAVSAVFGDQSRADRRRRNEPGDGWLRRS